MIRLPRRIKPASPSWWTFLLVCTVTLVNSPASGQVEYRLGPDDSWEESSPVPGTAEFQVFQARKALALGEPQRARALASSFLDRFPTDPFRADMLLIRGDALLQMGDEYKALFDYEEITQQHPGSRVFVMALEREFDIATAYANGLRRKFYGTFRLIDASDDAQELLIRIQERLPGSRLAEDAGMELADFYFRRSQMRLAADAYDLFIQNYPRSDRIEKARARLIQSYLASYRGPQYDDAGLRDARRRLESLRAVQPALAQRLGADSLLVRIRESEAQKLLTTSRWYLSINDPVSAEFYLRQVVERYPGTVAALDGLRLAPTIISRMPANIAAEAPDYQALAEALLGAAGPTEAGVQPAPETPLPESRQLAPERPVQAEEVGQTSSSTPEDS